MLYSLTRWNGHTTYSTQRNDMCLGLTAREGYRWGGRQAPQRDIRQSRRFFPKLYEVLQGSSNVHKFALIKLYLSFIYMWKPFHESANIALNKCVDASPLLLSALLKFRSTGQPVAPYTKTVAISWKANHLIRFLRKLYLAPIMLDIKQSKFADLIGS